MGNRSMREKKKQVNRAMISLLVSFFGPDLYRKSSGFFTSDKTGDIFFYTFLMKLKWIRYIFLLCF